MEFAIEINMQPRILIVEDDKCIRELVATFLGREKFALNVAADLESARKQFTAPAPDILLLDLQLPDGNGLSLLPDVKKNWPDTKVIILTGYGTVEVAEEAYKMDDLFLLAKPFDSEMLNSIVDLAMAARKKS
jgi:two-component system, NtrC family, response regulator HydG